MSNSILIEIVTIDDRDPPWINNKNKSLIINRTEYFKNCVKPNNHDSIRRFGQIQDALEKILKFLSISIIPNILENLQLIKSILHVTGSY